VSARSDAYGWRLLATAAAFALFGLSSLVLGVIVLPLLRVLPGSAAGRRRRVRALLGSCMRWFARVLQHLGVLTFEFRGSERLGLPGQLILANHPTLLDAIFLLGFAPSSGCIAKQSLWRNPITRWTVLAAGYVSNDPTDRMIEDASRALQEGQSVIIFPEGTRTVPGQALHFHRGAAAIAIRAASLVTPVFVRCSPPTLAKSDPWYRIPERRVHYSLRTGEDIDPEPYRRGTSGPLAARALNAVLVRRFAAEIGEPNGGSALL